MDKAPGMLDVNLAPSPNQAGKDISLRSSSETRAVDHEAQRAEARAILVRLLVQSCMERCKVAA